MDIKLVVAILRRERLEAVEERLRRTGVERIDIAKVKGYGEYRNLFKSDWTSEEVRVEIFTRQHKVEAITSAILEAAHTGMPGDGIVAVVPVDKLFLVRTKSEATPEDFWPKVEPSAHLGHPA